MKTKIPMWSVVSVLTVGIAIAAWATPRDAVAFPALGEPQTITMENGTTLKLLGTTFGSRHFPPGFENGRIANANWIFTASNTTVVWIQAEHKTNQWPSFELLVSDQSNSACVNIEESHPGTHVKVGVDDYAFALKAFPRWDKETILRVRPYQGATSKEHFVLTNPAPGTFAQWTPKPLPDTESDGDLEVTLTKVVACAPTPSWRGGTLAPTNDPVNQCVHLNFDFRRNGQSTTNWDPWPVQTTDAAGNWSRGLIYAYPTNGVRRIWGPMHDGSIIPPPEHYGMDGYFFQPGLWPNQPWKVRLEFIQRSGFSDDEMVTFSNVPVKPGSQQDADDEWTAWDVVKPKLPLMIPDSTALTPDTPRRDDGETNFPFKITPATVKGTHLKLLPPLLLTNRWQNGEMDVSIIIGAEPGFKPKDMNLTVVAATDDQGRELWHPFGVPWAGHYSIEFARVHDDIKSLNLKLALHKSRFVEFTVKPEKAGDAAAR
jgi:hypothetical protein